MRKINLNTGTHLAVPDVDSLPPGGIAINHYDGDMMIVKDQTSTGGEKKIIKIERAFNLYRVADIAERDAVFATGVVLPLDMAEYTNGDGKLQLDTLVSEIGIGEWDVLEVNE